MVIAFISFLCGRSTNNLDKDKSPKSPLTRVIRVFVAAMLNRNLHCPMDTTHLHENLEKEHDHLLPHTNSLRCLDKAAIPPSPEDAEENKWRLCRVTEVEENKLLLGTLPIWVTLVMCGIVLSVQQTLFVEQAYHMERALGSVKVPVTSLFVLAGLSKAAIYGVHFTPLDRITILGHGITPKLQIGFGMFSSILCCMTAALVERRRLDAYNRHYFVNEENEEDPKAVQRYSPMIKGEKNENDPNNGNNNDNGEATTSATERTMTTEMATVEQQESSTHIASSEYI
ncbi:protein NRT1/ PTR FAMILY 5.6-like [Magnolia sinica]|uniref:protein NRT1/ PTR FAMILY 5.6-like n=1 Tax=Magnolia sinica TaxID=86752 RepID=UPI00265A50B2|nr:protein NRT1/ PTR FAMILY 5.6-like [Magnolia sinica]